MTTKSLACSCGLKAGERHPDGYSEEFGGQRIVWNAGYETAHGTADYQRSQGEKARVFYEPGFGWSVQVAS
jgi:hypothetical protein